MYNATSCMIILGGSHIHCLSAAGVGANYSVVVAVDGAVSVSSTSLLSYGPPVISGVDGSGAVDGSGIGGFNIRLTGSNFGAASTNASILAWSSPASFKHLRFTAVGCHVVIDHTVIECVTAPGAGTALTWTLTVEGIPNMVPLSSYAPPRIRSVEFAEKGVSSAATTGGTKIRLKGENFGPILELLSVVVQSSSVATPRAAERCIFVVSGLELVCELPAGTGAVVGVAMTVIDQSGSFQLPRDQWLLYSPPVITRVTPSYISTDVAGTVFTVTGSGFGMDSGSVRLWLTSSWTCNDTHMENEVRLSSSSVVVRSDGELSFVISDVSGQAVVVSYWQLVINVSGLSPIMRLSPLARITTLEPIILAVMIESEAAGVITLLISGSNFGQGSPPFGNQVGTQK